MSDISEVDAFVAVADVLKGVLHTYQLEQCDVFKAANGKFSSPHYKRYNFACYKSSMCYTGWILCTYVANVGCTLVNGKRCYDMTVGTLVFMKQAESHWKRASASFSEMVKISFSLKKRFTDAAGVATSLGHLPILFSEQKDGLTLIAQTLQDIGKIVPIQKKIKANEGLPCAASVRTAIERNPTKIRENLKATKLPNIKPRGRVVNSDGLKDNCSGRTFYEFTFHYFNFSALHQVTE